MAGSALPATSQEELWKAYLQEGKHPQPQPRGILHCPQLQHPTALQDLAWEGPPGTVRVSTAASIAVTPHHDSNEKNKLPLHSQTLCSAKPIFYQVTDGAGGREIYRMEENYSYLHGFGREATKAPSSSKETGDGLALSEEWKVMCRLIAHPAFSRLLSFFQSTYSTVTFKTEKPIFYTRVYFKSQCLHRGN